MFYVRTSRRTGVGMPLLLAPFFYLISATFVLMGWMVKWSVIASVYLLKYAALFYVYAAKAVVRLARQGHAFYIERRAQRALAERTTDHA